jgi:integrase
MTSLFDVHIIPGLGALLITDIKPTDVKAWINKVGAKFSYSITHKCLTHVRAIFDQLVEDDLITKNPARSKKAGVRMPKTKKVDERFLQLSECHALLRAAQSPRDRLLLRVLNACALRPSEAFALQVSDVVAGKLRIDEAVVMGIVGQTKTKESNGVVPVSASLETEFRDYIAACGFNDPAQYLFPSDKGTPYDPKNYLNRILKPLGVRAGVLVYERTTKRGKKIKTSGLNFQILRRTCATHFQNHGGVKDVQALLRHTRPEISLKHYQKVLDAKLISAVESWDSVLVNETIQ